MDWETRDTRKNGRSLRELGGVVASENAGYGNSAANSRYLRPLAWFPSLPSTHIDDVGDVGETLALQQLAAPRLP
jgi:hypothetical protein